MQIPFGRDYIADFGAKSRASSALSEAYGERQAQAEVGRIVGDAYAELDVEERTRRKQRADAKLQHARGGVGSGNRASSQLGLTRPDQLEARAQRSIRAGGKQP